MRTVSKSKSSQYFNLKKRKRNDVKILVCRHCDKRFTSSNALKQHTRDVHSQVIPYKCGQCSKAFKRMADMRRHERTHADEQPYKYKICGAAFNKKSHLTTHKQAKHYSDKRYKCDNCGMCFQTYKNLWNHKKTMHISERLYEYDICQFANKEHLKKHIKIHIGGKYISIYEICDKGFLAKDDKVKHSFVHSDKRMYECPVCSESYMMKKELVAHIQKKGHVGDTIVRNKPRLTTGYIDNEVQL